MPDESLDVDAGTEVLPPYPVIPEPVVVPPVPTPAAPNATPEGVELLDAALAQVQADEVPTAPGT